MLIDIIWLLLEVLMIVVLLIVVLLAIGAGAIITASFIGSIIHKE